MASSSSSSAAAAAAAAAAATFTEGVESAVRGAHEVPLAVAATPASSGTAAAPPWNTSVADGKFVALPPRGSRFSVVLADPPWSYSGMFVQGGVGPFYDTVSRGDLEQLAGYIGTALTPRDAVLYLWATWPKIEEAYAFVRAAGFTNVTLALIYTKRYRHVGRPYVGPGMHSRSCTEALLVATKGRGVPVSATPGTTPAMLRHVHALAAGDGGDAAAAAAVDTPPPIVLAEPLGSRTSKPDIVHDLIERTHGACVPRLELFARRRRAGWWAWGNEPDHFVPLRVPSAAWWRGRIAAARVYAQLAEERRDGTRPFAGEDADAVDAAVRGATGYDPDAP